MSDTAKPGAQQGGQTTTALQQGQTQKPGPQQGSTPVIRDWAAI